jgi:hypothetical protein
MTTLRKHPTNTPLEEWPSGWLKMEVASMLGDCTYIMMHDHEKKAADLPVTDEDMRTYIRKCRSKR